MPRKAGDVDLHHRPLYEATGRYLAVHATATQDEVEIALGKEFPDAELPGRATVTRWISKLRPAPAAPWTLADAVPSEARWVVPLLAHLVLGGNTFGRGDRLVTKPTAKWIAHLCEAVPELQAPEVAGDLVGFAQTYAWVEGRNESTEDLDLLLSFSPWRDGGARYARAVRLGVIDASRVVVSAGGPSTSETLWELFEERAFHRFEQSAKPGDSEALERVDRIRARVEAAEIERQSMRRKPEEVRNDG